MWKSSSAAGLAALVWAAGPSTARAGACCVGATAAVPTRLGPCERWAAGVGVQAQRGVGRWDAAGQPVDSSLQEDALVSTAAAGYRWSRSGQVVVQAPARVQRSRAGELAQSGGGLGDLVVQTLWNPVEELPRAAGGGRPVPVVSLGARLPTGRSWEQSDDPLLADVTGRPGADALAAVWLERTTERVPWSLGLDGGLGLGHADAHVALTGMVGRIVGPRWTALATLRSAQTFAEGGRTLRTRGGARVVHGRSRAWRAWADVSADVPIAGLGFEAARSVDAGLGLLVVR